MEERGVGISVETVRRRLRKSGGKFSNEISKLLLKEYHRKKRLQWANNIRILIVIELFLQMREYFNYYIKKKGCFSASGFGKLFCFQRNLNAEFMCTIYEQNLLASTSKLFGEGNIDWILQEDYDLKHRSKIAKKWKEENGIKVLSWPSMSPDQNLIENVWRRLKGELTKEWNRLSPVLAMNLVASIKRRTAALIESDNDYT
ncbi:10905_t:CDS:2, partial [Funneliformis geosporum]